MKECRSCGNYYSGDYCDKCGYGKKTGVSKASKKYRKGKKPERFQTAEDKKLYAKWDKEERLENAARTKDQSANKNFLIAVVLVAVIVVFIALFQSGAIFSNTREEVVKQYFEAVRTGDFDSFVKCFPKEIKNDYKADLAASDLDKSAYMQALYGDFADTYGAGYTIKVEFGGETALDPDDYDMTLYREQYGHAPSLSEVYEMVVNATFSGHNATETAKLYMYVAKTGGYWRIFGISEDLGTMTEEDMLAAEAMS